MNSFDVELDDLIDRWIAKGDTRDSIISALELALLAQREAEEAEE